MRTRRDESKIRAGFTLVELLTVMAIIALLIGLLVPALGHVKTTAKIVQQKAQLKSIETALEAFSGMYGDYPPSNESSPTNPYDYTAATYITCGSQKMTEAILGVDLRGFDPKSKFDRREIELDRYMYALQNVPATTNAQDVTDSLNRRKGPYVTINENLGNYELGDLYNLTGSPLYGGGSPRDKQYGNLLCDVFKVKTITYKSYDFTTNPPTEVLLTAKVGTPILYYKADPAKKQLDATSDATIDASTYNWHDNMHLVALGRLADQTKPHWWLDTTNPARGGVAGTLGDAAAFYSYIQNPKIGATRWPYNPDSYILISAGPDGVYGTGDDITNFGASESK